MPHTQNRRAFLRSTALPLVASPFLSLLSGKAWAQDAGQARRLVIFFSPNGTVHNRWRPEGTGRDYQLPAGSILEPLAAYREQMIVCSGIDFFGVTNHEGGMQAMLTGGGGARSATGGMSVDQYIAGEIGGGTRFRSVELGVITSPWGASVQTRMSYRSPGQHVPPNDNPADAWQRLFSNLGEPDAAALSRLRSRRSVLDLVTRELRSLRTTVGLEEGAKLDAHLTSLREIEGSLGAAVAGGCLAPDRPGRLGISTHSNFPQLGRIQTDLLVTALSCGLTRVASLQWSHTVSPVVVSWLGFSEAHHSLSHIDDSNRPGVDRFVAAERWFAEQFAYLLDRLDALPEPGGEGSMLDHSVVLWAKEMGDSRRHSCLSVPFVIAGRGGGMQLGRHVDFRSQPHQKLLVSLCHAMGLDNPTFGDPAHGVGPLPGLI